MIILSPPPPPEKNLEELTTGYWNKPTVLEDPTSYLLKAYFNILNIYSILVMLLEKIFSLTIKNLTFCPTELIHLKPK